MFQRKRRYRGRGRAGITLIEMLVVMTIIALFAALVGPSIFKHSDTARITAARAQIHNFMTALGAYKLDTGTFPTSEQGLQALITQPTTPPVPTTWKGPYLDPPVLRQDPWRHPYYYKNPGTRNPSGYDLYSAGPNGIEGDEDDIGNWQ
jgi:general secretion pathway protein G